MIDRILLRDLRFYGYHGVHPEEQRLGQPFAVDLEAELDLRRAGQRDDLSDTVSYSALFEVVRSVVEGEPRQLLEAVAEEIARRVLGGWSMIDAVTVRVWKLAPPIPGVHSGRVGVVIRRTRASDSAPDLYPEGVIDE